MKVGITGASGNLGSSLCSWFSNKQFEIVCLLRTSGSEKLFSNTANIYGDITSTVDELRQFVENLDTCIHLAAAVGYVDRTTYQDVNVLGTQNLCDAICKYNPDCHLIFVSTISALKICFWNWPFATQYAKSKWRAEKLVENYKRNHGLKVSTVYPGYVYGSSDKRLIPEIVRFLQKKYAFLISGGEKNAPLIYSDDLCDLFERIAVNSQSIGKKYLAINVYPGGMHGLFSIVARHYNLPFPKIKLPKFLMYVCAILVEWVYQVLRKYPPFSRRHVHALTMSFSSRRYEYLNARGIGWSPKVDLEYGLISTLRYMPPHT